MHHDEEPKVRRLLSALRVHRCRADLQEIIKPLAGLPREIDAAFADGASPAVREVRIVLPFPPSINSYYGHRVVKGKYGKPMAAVYLTDKGRQYREAVVARIVEQFGVLKPWGERLAYEVIFHAPTRRKCDLSNYLKAWEDALTHARVWIDDSLIDQITVTRGSIIAGGCLDVTLRTIEQPKATLF